MKGRFPTLFLVPVLSLALLTGLKAQESQSPAPSTPPSVTQPQTEPQPNQDAPQQEPPKDQPQAQPPNTTPPQSEPGQSAPTQDKPEEKPQSQSPQETPQPVSPVQVSPSGTAKPKPRTTAKSRSARKKSTTSSKTESTNQSGKVVVRNGGAREATPQISPGVNDQQAQNQRNVTNQLLATTDANLKKVSGKQLTPTQQSMLDQVNSYVRQSKVASDAGDTSRAHTLAVKAQLLSNELARK